MEIILSICYQSDRITVVFSVPTAVGNVVRKRCFSGFLFAAIRSTFCSGFLLTAVFLILRFVRAAVRSIIFRRFLLAAVFLILRFVRAAVGSVFFRGFLLAAVFFFLRFVLAAVRNAFFRGFLLTAFFYVATVMSGIAFRRLAVSGKKEENQSEN